MRKRFLDEFDALWFDSLNGDSRETGKLTPQGKPDPSVFSTPYNREGIRVGTAIATMVRKPERATEPAIRYREFWGEDKRTELVESLRSENLNAAYTSANPTAGNYFAFRPSQVAPGYLTWPKVTDLSAESPSNGLMEKRGGALIDIDRGRLEERMRKYYDGNVSWEVLESLDSGLTRDAANFDAKLARAKVLKAETFESDRLQRYLFRPSDVRWCYYSPVPPLWNRARIKLSAQTWQGNSFLISRMNAANADEGLPFTFTRVLLDDHVLAPDASGFPILLQKNGRASTAMNTGQTGLRWNGEEQAVPPTANLSTGVRGYLAALGIHNPDQDVETASLVWMHALAIGCSPAYLKENADGIRQDWPRIPLPTTRDALLSSADLGQKIALLLDTETEVPEVTTGRIRPELRLIGAVRSASGSPLDPSAGDLALTAGWGYSGSSGETMPGQGRVERREYSPEELAAIRQAASSLGLSDTEALVALGETTLDIYLNERAYWQNVPINVWNFRIGGYQVIKKWLSYRDQELLKRPLSYAEALEASKMVRRLAAIRLLEPVLDVNYQRAINEVYEWSNSGQMGLLWGSAQ